MLLRGLGWRSFSLRTAATCLTTLGGIRHWRFDLSSRRSQRTRWPRSTLGRMGLWLWGIGLLILRLLRRSDWASGTIRRTLWMLRAISIKLMRGFGQRGCWSRTTRGSGWRMDLRDG